ncbi:MAG: hypothetical protein ABEI52_02355 [Halobacteriaceae archaeon]
MANQSTNVPVYRGLAIALNDWRRNVIAILIVVISYGFAVIIGSNLALYAAALIAFSTWMGWFVLTGVEFINLVT